MFLLNFEPTESLTFTFLARRTESVDRRLVVPAKTVPFGRTPGFRRYTACLRKGTAFWMIAARSCWNYKYHNKYPSSVKVTLVVWSITFLPILPSTQYISTIQGLVVGAVKIHAIQRCTYANDGDEEEVFMWLCRYLRWKQWADMKNSRSKPMLTSVAVMLPMGVTTHCRTKY